METNQGDADSPTAMREDGPMIIWMGWKVDLFITEAGNLGITVDMPNPGMSPNPEAAVPFVDIFVTPDLEVTSDSTTDEATTEALRKEQEIYLKYQTYSDFHKDFYGFRPRGSDGESPEQIAARYDSIAAEMAALKTTRKGRDKLRSNAWVIPEPCIHCGKAIEADPETGIWHHVEETGLGAKRFCSDMQAMVAEPEPYPPEESENPEGW